MDWTDNTGTYYNTVRNALTGLVTATKLDSATNQQDLKVRSEDFFYRFLNLLFDWSLVNANEAELNTPGIDLRWQGGGVIAQVSSTHTHKKIQESLDKSDRPDYAGYHFYFVAITEKMGKLAPFRVPEGLTFHQDEDIFSMSVLLKRFKEADAKKQKALADLAADYYGTGAKPALRCLTALPPRADTGSVICRDTELADVQDLLRKGRDVLLMSGFGGIGKTSLARLVFYTVLDEYDEVAWVPYRGSLENSLMASFSVFDDVRDPDERWRRILALEHDGLKKLIVVDNADSGNVQKELLPLFSWRNTDVIVTSRHGGLKGAEPYRVGFLDEDRCVELFYRYYENAPDAAEEETVRELIRLAGRHTFTVELLAKGANCEPDLADYLAALKKEGFAFPEVEFEVGHHDANATIAEHLKKLFDMKTRGEVETELLWDFAVLPSGASLTRYEISDWFGIDVNACEQLVRDGWLIRNKGRYAMHPLVRQILRLDEVPEGTAAPFLAFIANYHNGYFPEDEVYTEITRRLELAAAVTDAVCKGRETEQMGYISHNLGDACRQLARYDDALRCYHKALEIKENLLGKEHTYTATTCNNLAGVYRDMGDLPKAREYYEQALAIYGNVQGKEHPDMATTSNGLATVYQAMGDLPMALEYLEIALAIRENLLGKGHPSTAATYNNLAGVYQAMGDLPRALEYLKEDRAISEKELGKEHPSTATTYHNLALVYQDMGDLSMAQAYCEKALAIRKKVLGKEHPNTAITYWNMGALYFKIKQYSVAINYCLRALQVLLVKLGPGHPYTMGIYGWLSAAYQAQHGETESFLPWLRGQLNEEENRALDELLKE